VAPTHTNLRRTVKARRLPCILIGKKASPHHPELWYCKNQETTIVNPASPGSSMARKRI